MRTILPMLALAVVILTGAAPALAQPALINPFSSAEALLAERGGAANATFRARYAVDDSIAAPSHFDLTIDAGADWALVRQGQLTQLYDFKLGRILTITGETFSSMNLIAPVMFRVIERQNRDALQGILDTAGNRSELAEPCDADVELGVTLPGLTHSSRLDVRETRGVLTATCGRRTVQTIDLGDGSTPPPAFWPALRASLRFHPVVMDRIQQSAHAPGRVRSEIRNAAVLLSDAHLMAVEAIDTPFPIHAGMANITAQALDQTLGAGMSAVALDALAGRTTPGPSLESWSDYIVSTRARDGDASAVIVLGVGVNMFPDLIDSCNAGARIGVCASFRDVRSIISREPAARDFYRMVTTEQEHDFAGGVEARAALKNTSIEHHPAVDASFALILIEGGAPVEQQARTAGLPTDARALQVNAIRGYPYNPAYWTDAGDLFAMNYDYPSAFLLYDIAYSLPVPGAHAGAPAGREGGAQRIRHDFPQFFLP